MRVKRSIQLRRCKLCGKTGHNSARCEKNAIILKSKKIAKISTNNELLKKPSQVILVRQEQFVKHSPHVVDLKRQKDRSDDIWSKVKAFAEKPAIKEERRLIDFGAMVRAHREKSEMKTEEQKIEKAKKQKSKPEEEFKSLKISKSKNLVIGDKKEIKKLRNWEIKNKLNGNLTEIKHKLNKLFQRVTNYQLPVTNYKFNLNYKKFAYASIILFILASLPFPALSYYNSVKDTSAKVVEESTNAFLSLQSSMVATMQTNLDQAQFDLNLALQSFGAADSILEKEHRGLLYVASLLPVIGKEVSGRQSLLLAGHQLALGNAYLLKGVREAEVSSSLPLTDRFEILTNHLQAAIPEYKDALTELTKIDPEILPIEYQKSFLDFKLLYAAFISDMNNLVELARSLNLVFGSNEPKRYLLVFQNNGELRPTGGFAGSFAIMDVQKGKLMNLDIPGGGTYDLQGQLDQYVKPPLPLQLVNARWEFQDANWFPDFSESAQKMAWFYQHSRGATVDGVIAINASVLERLLKVLGPIKSDNFNLEIGTNNALATLQKQVEVDYDKEMNQPKAVLADLAPQFFERFKGIDASSAARLLSELQDALSQKEIQIYFTDDNLENHFKNFGWTGEVVPVADNQDYLLVVNANLNGQKSDAKIQQKIDHQALVQADGSILDTVVIERIHTGSPGEMFYGANNVSYVRVYVPVGSELVSAGGFNFPPEDFFHVPESWYKDDADLSRLEKEIKIDSQTGTRITSEFGKTAFGNWVMVAPGQTTKAYFTYRLPFKIKINNNLNMPCSVSSLAECGFFSIKNFMMGKDRQASKYSLIVQKQSGLTSVFSTRIIYPEGWTPVWQTNEQMNLAINGGEYNGDLKNDQVFGLVMEKN